VHSSLLQEFLAKSLDSLQFCITIINKVLGFFLSSNNINQCTVSCRLPPMLHLGAWMSQECHTSSILIFQRYICNSTSSKSCLIIEFCLYSTKNRLSENVEIFHKSVDCHSATACWHLICLAFFCQLISSINAIPEASVMAASIIDHRRLYTPNWKDRACRINWHSHLLLY